jgi:3-oxoacyl-[acyl-carrier protein] reductase
MDLQLSDKVVLVTGASGGIGRALAEAFAAEGARLVLHGHDHAEDLEAWRARQPWAERALTATGDVSDPGAMEAVVTAGTERWGRLDVAIANAGIWIPGDVGLATLDTERIRRTMDVNLFGSFWTARAFLAALATAGPRADGHGACLIFIGSTAGRFGEKGHSDYAASKAGLYGLVRTLKNEIVDLDPFGRVNMIEPGWTVTHMARPALEQPGALERVVTTMPLRQLARAADIARTAVVIASPYASRHLTGQVVTVAGGMEGRTLWSPDDVDAAAIRRRIAEA